MLIGYVSDEKYVALADVLVEFTNDKGEAWEARSRAGASIHCDLPPGEYLVTLAKAGYGSKRVRMTPQSSEPYQFRLLSDSLLGVELLWCASSGGPSSDLVSSPDEVDIGRSSLSSAEGPADESLPADLAAMNWASSQSSSSASTSASDMDCDRASGIRGELLALIIAADERFAAERYVVCDTGEEGEVAAPREAVAAPCRYERLG